MSISVERAGVVPATLSFLSIYNPSLSTSDETFEDQIVYYYSRPSAGRKTLHQSNDGSNVEETKEEKDEKLRQIGLAQGMVSFAKNFSNGKPVDWIETEKSRIILHELEQDWWLLASVDLTRLPSSSVLSAHDDSQSSATSTEYSAREVCPPALLLQQALRAHQVFLLHQAPSMADLYARVARPKFCGYLSRFWDEFIWNWDVLLNGNPAVDIFNGLKLAAGGELGIGVGEEDWGSGEREVLEGFIARTEGLVDMVVSRFGDAPHAICDQPANLSPERSVQDTMPHRQSSGEYQRPSDGIIFSGIGALTRHSVRNVSSWMELLHKHEQNAYGIRDNPSSAPRRKRRNLQSLTSSHPDTKLDNRQRGSQVLSSAINESQKDSNGPQDNPGIPPSIFSKDTANPRTVSSTNPRAASTKQKEAEAKTSNLDSNSGTETIMKYLTLGVYGSTWGIPSGRPPLHSRVSSLRENQLSRNPRSSASSKKTQSTEAPDTPRGFFLVGLQGELEEVVQSSPADPESEAGIDAENASERVDSNNRVVMRTLHVERVKGKSPESNGMSVDSKNETTETFFDRLRVVVYLQKPFIFTFLFELQTDALAMPFFYRSLHHQLGPLQRPLLASTSPSKVSERLWEAAAPKSTASTTSNQPIGDLIFDPVRLTVHTTIPNIPEPGGPTPADSTITTRTWSRVEALSVHSQILNTYSSTRRHMSELERTCKTSRGWWVVWMRLPHSLLKQNAENNANAFREAFLIRRASDHVSPAPRKPSGRVGRDISGASGSGGWGPGKLAEGIGIDARQYIEGLLSLSR